MPVTADAILEDHKGRTVLRFERRYPHPPERIWRAIRERTAQQPLVPAS